MNALGSSQSGGPLRKRADSDIACLCNNITYGMLHRAIRQEKRENVRSVAGYGRGCGLCVAAIERYLDDCFLSDLE